MMQQDHLLLYSNMQDLIIIVPLPPVPHQKIPGSERAILQK